MDEHNTQQLLAQILAEACEPREDTPAEQDISPEILASVYRLAQVHDLAHVVSWYIHKHKLQVPAELETSLKTVEFRSVFRYEQLKHTLKEICEAFEAIHIPYIPLKGSVIRPFYPVEWMRTSCDIDILIHEEDLAKAISALQAKGYIWDGKKEFHDVSLFSPGKIHLELHFNIREGIESLDGVLKDAWVYAEPVEGSQYQFKKEFFVFHMYAHMAYHFLAGGCGLRALMDIWIMEHRMDAHYRCAEALLKKAEIYSFAAEISNIANRHFSSKPLDHLDQQVLHYIYCGGVYGSKANHIAIYKSQGSSTLRYVIERIFLPYNSMTITYPILTKAPYLLPIYWVVRWCKVLFAGKPGRLAKEIACANNISSEYVAQTKAICKKLGL